MWAVPRAPALGVRHPSPRYNDVAYMSVIVKGIGLQSSPAPRGCVLSSSGCGRALDNASHICSVPIMGRRAAAVAAAKVFLGVFLLFLWSVSCSPGSVPGAHSGCAWQPPVGVSAASWSRFLSWWSGGAVWLVCPSCGVWLCRLPSGGVRALAGCRWVPWRPAGARVPGLFRLSFSQAVPLPPGAFVALWGGVCPACGSVVAPAVPVPSPLPVPFRFAP